MTLNNIAYVIYVPESCGYEAPLAIVYAASESDALTKYETSVPNFYQWAEAVECVVVR